MAFDPLPRRLRPLALALLAGTLLLSGCGGSSAKADEPSPAEVMKVAKKNFDDASSVHIALSTSATPSSGNGVLGADGDLTQAPAFQGEVKVVLGGLTATVPITSVGGKVYAQIPLTPGWSEVNPADYGAPDPAQLVSADQGLPSILAATTDPQQGHQVRGGVDNKEVLTTYTGNVPATAAGHLIPGASGDFQATYGVTSDGELRTAELTGAFYSGKPALTYALTLEDYGTSKDITAP